jgi:GT2 family glycosyltransferase
MASQSAAGRSDGVAACEHAPVSSQPGRAALPPDPVWSPGRMLVSPYRRRAQDGVESLLEHEEGLSAARADVSRGRVVPADTAVVICAYTDERWNELVAAVRSIEAQPEPPGELVVVIDHNEELLQRARAEFGNASLQVVANGSNRGLGGARNTGVAVTSADVVIFLDDDAEATEGWLERICAAYADSDVLGVGGRIDAVWTDRRPTWFPAEFEWVVGCSYRGLPTEESPVRNLIGCNMSFRRLVFAELGGFSLGYGCDETEFCLRIGQRWPDARLVYAPDAVVRHHVSASRHAFRHFRERCYFEGGSKAVVTWLHPARVGLSSERAYTFKTLPHGVLDNVLDSVLRRRPGGIARATAIVAGLAFTTAGFVAGKASMQRTAVRRGYQPGEAQREH